MTGFSNCDKMEGEMGKYETAKVKYRFQYVRLHRPVYNRLAEIAAATGETVPGLIERALPFFEGRYSEPMLMPPVIKQDGGPDVQV